MPALDDFDFPTPPPPQKKKKKAKIQILNATWVLFCVLNAFLFTINW